MQAYGRCKLMVAAARVSLHVFRCTHAPFSSRNKRYAVANAVRTAMWLPVEIISPPSKPDAGTMRTHCLRYRPDSDDRMQLHSNDYNVLKLKGPLVKVHSDSEFLSICNKSIRYKRELVTRGFII